MRRALAAMVVGLGAPAAACFSPSFERCAVECAAGECPPGSFCLEDGRCHAQPDEALCAVGDDIDGGGEADGGTDATPTDASLFDAGIPVTPTEAGQLVISEIFKNPSQTIDEEPYEWFEIHNPTDLRFELMGLEVHDDMGQTFDVETSVVLPPHGRLVFARNGDAGMNGGVDEDYDYDDDFALGNGGDVIEIVYPLGDVSLDRVEYLGGPDGWPNDPGRAMSLEPDLHDATSNDQPTSWCEATVGFGTEGDFGTPGAPNPDC